MRINWEPAPPARISRHVTFSIECATREFQRQHGRAPERVVVRFEAPGFSQLCCVLCEPEVEAA